MKRALLIGILLASSTAHAIRPKIPNENNPPTESPITEGQEGQSATEPQEDPSKHFNFFDFSYRGKDEFGGPVGDGKMEEKDANGNVTLTVREEEPMSAPFVLMLVNFGLLLIILAKYGWPVAGKLAADRHDQIKTALDDAAKLREAAKTKLAEYEARVAGLDGEIKKLVDGIRADADADKARILEQAKAQSAQLKKEADQRIAAEIELARTALTKEVTAAATQAAEKVLKEKVTAEDQRGLVTTFIKNVEAQRAS